MNIESLSKVVAAMGLVLVVSIVASCDSKQQAACEQVQVAGCLVRSHCGGVDDQTCEAERAGVGSAFCSTTVDAATACVQAANAVLANTCTKIPTLPCPDIAASPGESCRVDAECEAGLTCTQGACAPPSSSTTTCDRDPSVLIGPYAACTSDANCPCGFFCGKSDPSATGVCTANCHADTDCPANSGGSPPTCSASGGNVCLLPCQIDADCGSGLKCGGGSCVPA